MKASDWSPSELDNYGMILMLGRSGCGKSGAGATHPGKRVIMDMDMRFGGIGAMTKQKSATNQIMVDPNDLEYYQFPATAKGYADFYQRCDMLAQQFQGSGKNGFPAMIQFDSAASWNEMCMKYAAGANANIGQFVQVGTGPKIRLTHMGDYRFEVSEVRDTLNKLKSFPCTIIWTGHLIPRWGKAPNAPEYAENTIVGEMLNARDKFAEDFVSRFDNVFRFDRTETNGKMRFTVKFFTDLAKNTFGIPPGEHNVTDIPFFVYFKELLKNPDAPTSEVRKALGLK